MTRRAGFTLIEMLAVVTIFALLASLAIPALSTLSGRTLWSEAEQLGAKIDLARQRSVMTGIRHRVLIDLDAGSYRMEWYVNDFEARGERAPLEPATYDVDGDTPLPLSAPRREARDYRPLPGLLGRDVRFDEDLAVVRVESNESWVERGESYVAFERDGTVDYSVIVIDDSAGNAVALDVLPLADVVQIHDESL